MAMAGIRRRRPRAGLWAREQEGPLWVALCPYLPLLHVECNQMTKGRCALLYLYSLDACRCLIHVLYH